jgi:hypothetical protein
MDTVASGFCIHPKIIGSLKNLNNHGLKKISKKSA